MCKKENFVWFNGKMVSWKDAKIHVSSHALHYGTSVFEGIRCYNSYKGPVIFRHYDHIKRLMDSAKIYRMPVSWTIDQFMKACRMVICKNGLSDAYIRPLVFIGDVGMEVNPLFSYVTDVAIMAFSWKPYFGKDSLHKGIDLMVSSWNRVAVNTLPTLAKAGGNYLSSLLISNEARRHGYHEGIGLDVHGYVSEGAGENLFEVKNNVIFTPPYMSSILPGLTRDSIIKLAKTIGFEVKEQVLLRESLYVADEIFISGTAAEIVPVRSVDGIKIGNGQPGLITRKLQKMFFNLFTGEVSDIWNWLDLV